MLRKNITGRNKYGNTRFFADNQKWDSKKEYQRYLVLKDAEKKGAINNLRRQVKFELLPPVTEEFVEHLKTKDKVKQKVIQRCVSFIADFTYQKGDELIVEDVKISKSLLPKEYILKKKMMLALLGIKVKESFSVNDAI